MFAVLLNRLVAQPSVIEVKAIYVGNDAALGHGKLEKGKGRVSGLWAL